MIGGSAVITDCGRYRYRLTRHIGAGDRDCLFVMLNPSTADAHVDDATIHRCMGYARAWRCHELVVVNLFAVRATDPKALYAAADPVGPDNMDHVKAAVEAVTFPTDPAVLAGLVVCAWGAHGAHMDQDETVLGWIEAAGGKPLCLARTKDGLPAHPLRLPKELVPFPYTGRTR